MIPFSSAPKQTDTTTAPVSPGLLFPNQLNNQPDGVIDFVAIYRYLYQKRYVYVGVTAGCNGYGLLLDRSCQPMEGPDVSYPDFSDEATEKVLLWQRPD